MALIEIASGSIAAYVYYQVVGGDYINYNTVSYFPGERFVGVSGVTTFSAFGGSIVTEATFIEQFTVEVVPAVATFFDTDITQVKQFTAEFTEINFYEDAFTTLERIQNGTYFIDVDAEVFSDSTDTKITTEFGTALYNGLRYSELLTFASGNPNIVLTVDSDDNIVKATLPSITILF